jgi:hypothetical protein
MPSPPREKPARIQGRILIICPRGNSGRPGAVHEASVQGVYAAVSVSEILDQEFRAPSADFRPTFLLSFR